MADNNIDPELIRELTEKYESMRDAMSSMIPAMVLSTTAINQMIAASKGLKNTEQDATEVVKDFIKSIKKTTEETEKEAESKAKAKKKEDAREALYKSLYKSLGDFNSALLSSAAGMSKYQTAISTGAKGIGDFAEKFGPWGQLFSKAMAIFSFFTEQVLKQNDEMIKSYDSLSEVGATSALTTNDIRKLGLNAGYTSERLDKFTNIAKDLGSNLVALGGSTSKGVVEFSKLATVTQAQRDGFNNLGISQEQLTKMQGNYVKQTTAAGMALAKSPEQLRKESLKYIDSLVELAALTGMSVQKQQEALDIANADENFNQYKASQGMKRQALLEQAENEQDQNRKKELMAQADVIQKTIEQKDAYAKVAVNTMSAANAAAVLQSISTDGATVYTEANAKLLMAGIDVARHNREMNAGRSQEVELLESQVKASRRFTNMFGNAASAYGEYSKELQKEFGIDNKIRQTAAEFDRLKTEEGKREFLEQRKINKQEIDAKKAGLGPDDAAKKAQNAQLAAELAVQRALNELTASATYVTSGFTKLMEATMALGKLFANVTYKLGGPDVRHLFKTPEELKKDIADLTKDASNLESALSKEVKLREDKLKADEAYNKKDKELQEAKQKAIALGKQGPIGKSEEDVKAWQKSRIDQDKLVKKLEEERTKLGTETYRLKREIEQRGMDPKESRLKEELAKKRAEIENAKKRASDAGVPTATPATAGVPTAPKVQQATPQQLEERSANAANLGRGIAGREEDALAKLRFKDRKENTGGGKADPKLIDIAQKINEAFPNSTITAMNDLYHQNRRDKGGNIIKSRHTDGKALDFSMNPPPKDADEAALFKQQIQQMGASKVLDEYFTDKNSRSTGGHFHVEVARNGGLFKGPDTGYPVILHGEELITPINKVQEVTKTELSALPAMDSGSSSTPSVDNSMATTMASMMELLSEKLDIMIDKLETGNELQDDLIKQSMI